MTERQPYKPTYHADGRKVYDPSRTERDIWDEWAAFEERVRAEDPDCRFPEMRARELWRQEEQAKETWSQWQQRDWLPRMRALVDAKPNLNFTKAELGRMVEHFAMANDPIAISIANKAAKIVIDMAG